MRAIIFGINGQDGYYIREISLKKKIEVLGISRLSGGWIQGDVSNFNFVQHLIKKRNHIIFFISLQTPQPDTIHFLKTI